MIGARQFALRLAAFSGETQRELERLEIAGY